MFKNNRTIAKSDIQALNLDTRVSVEATITDARAEEVDREQLARRDVRLEHFVMATAWRRYMFGFFGPLAGKTVLDIACGYAMTPIIFALAGARVYAVDVAPKTIALNQWFAELKGVADRVKLHVGPAEELPFENETFDIVYGGAALHHLQLDRAALEISRVMKNNAKGGFQDPLGHNKVLEFARDRLSYNNKHPVKGTDLPLRVEDVDRFGQYFTTYTYRGFDLMSMAAKPLNLKKSSRLGKGLAAFDAALFETVPYLQRYARFVVTCVTK